ncbi:MAG: hypothetical protein ACRC9L_01385 [Brevinema sp.]
MKTQKVMALVAMFVMVGACSTAPKEETLEEFMVNLQGGWDTGTSGIYTFEGLNILQPTGTLSQIVTNAGVVNGKKYAIAKSAEPNNPVTQSFIQYYRVEGDTMYTTFDIGSQTNVPSGTYAPEEVFGTKVK